MRLAMANLDENPTQLTTLCVTRKSGESIVIGDDCRITVEIIRNRVKVRVTAPRTVRIIRAELQPH
jgi:carbon storage regulator CsrA